jgi:toxin ParE1/3/4
VNAKSVIPRERARQDIQDAIDYYAREAGELVALAFVDALEGAFRASARRPAQGPPRYAHELNLPGLRSLLLKRYPYLISYIDREDRIDIWRLLHARRDIPAWIQDPEDRAKRAT